MNAVINTLLPQRQRHHESNAGAPSTIFEPYEFNGYVESIRYDQYPCLKGTVYLDHAGTTPYPKSAIESYTSDLTFNLFGNPHSASAASQLSTRRIDDVRLKVLKFFNTDPDEFDLVFVANATSAIKLVAEAFRDHEHGFDYYYHRESHTSMVGVREIANVGSLTFHDDTEVDGWIVRMENSSAASNSVGLFGYPGQSNMTGRQLPLEWCRRIRALSHVSGQRLYTLLDAASLASTSPLDLGDSHAAPDFVAVSFYKTFGFPDLGGLLVRRRSADVLLQKRFFAGGTVDAVTVSDTPWHEKRACVHAALEEGTLPFHNIIALDHAMTSHARLFGSMQQVAQHTHHLAHLTRMSLKRLTHGNGSEVCEVYSEPETSKHGPIVSFNLKDRGGRFISAAEVEKLCIVKGFQIRTGGLCNPGGISRYLNLTDARVKASHAAGRRCGDGNDIADGQPMGAIRVSYGAMSTMADMQAFLGFIQEYYATRNVLEASFAKDSLHSSNTQFHITDLAIFPIKSCAAFQIPADQRWKVTSKGLAWDREWCLVHEGTSVALSQKKYPKMALLQPTVDPAEHKLTIKHGLSQHIQSLTISLDEDSEMRTIVSNSCTQGGFRTQNATVCGDNIILHVYESREINQFFSDALEVPCCLARYPSSSKTRSANMRRPKAHRPVEGRPEKPPSSLANESPMLIVSESSVNELNEQIRVNAQSKGIKEVAVSAKSFRANVTVAEKQQFAGSSNAYVEDTWASVEVVPQRIARLPIVTTSNPVCHTSDAEESEIASASDMSSEIATEFYVGTPSGASSYTSRSDLSQSLHATPSSNCTRSKAPVKIDILGPCQRCQMVSINQETAISQQEPFSTLAKTRRKGDGRVWFGVHAALNFEDVENGERYLQVGDLIVPSVL